MDSICSMLRTKIGPGVTEIGCHPGYIHEDYATSYSAERETELRTICSPVVRQTIEELEIELISYNDLSNVEPNMEEGAAK